MSAYRCPAEHGNSSPKLILLTHDWNNWIDGRRPIRHSESNWIPAPRPVPDPGFARAKKTRSGGTGCKITARLKPGIFSPGGLAGLTIAYGLFSTRIYPNAHLSLFTRSKSESGVPTFQKLSKGQVTEQLFLPDNKSLRLSPRSTLPGGRWLSALPPDLHHFRSPALAALDLSLWLSPFCESLGLNSQSWVRKYL